MSKPSLSDFLALPKPETKITPPAQSAEDTINLSLRITRSQWEALLLLTTAERTKIQPFLRGLLADEFERRGLRF